MSGIGLILAIAVPLMLLMLGAVLYNRSVLKKQERQNQARVIRQKAGDLLEALEFLILVDDHKEIQETVLERINELYHLSVELGDKDVPEEAFDMGAYSEKIQSANSYQKVLKSDRELKYGRRQFSTVLKALSLMAKKKVIPETTMAEYRRYLKMTLLDREVDTYTSQGDIAASRGDIVTAANYFKAARKLLIEFDIKFPEKNARVKEIAEKTAALYRGEQNELPGETEGNLSRGLSQEASAETNEFGMSSDPDAVKKRY